MDRLRQLITPVGSSPRVVWFALTRRARVLEALHRAGHGP